MPEVAKDEAPIVVRLPVLLLPKFYSPAGYVVFVISWRSTYRQDFDAQSLVPMLPAKHVTALRDAIEYA